jgi:hypothetical protein
VVNSPEVLDRTATLVALPSQSALALLLGSGCQPHVGGASFPQPRFLSSEPWDHFATEHWPRLFGMLSLLAELQRELIVANTRDGLAAAHVRGRAGGRPLPRLSAHHSALTQQLHDR